MEQSLTKTQLVKIAQKRQKIRSDLHTWCEHALQPLAQIPAAHHEIIIKALQELADGENDRLMISLPPGSAKSTYASCLFPAWFIANNKNKNVVLASHSASLAENFSAQTRNMIADYENDLGVSILSNHNSVERWKTTNGATYRCVGVGGAITGFRADLIICDDLVKSRDDADSPARRETLWRWYRADLFTRLKPKGKIVVIATRWHEDDILGRLLQDQPDEWKVLKLPALCDDEENDLLGRKLGEPLWPEWQPLEDLERIRRTVGEREWGCLYQQSPKPDGGQLFDMRKTHYLTSDTSLAGCTFVRAWDIAATAQFQARNPDFTVGLLLARTKEGRFIVVDVVQFRAEPNTVMEMIKQTAAKDGKSIPISLPTDPGASGKFMANFMIRELAGYDVETSREMGAKVGRATPCIAQWNGGNVSLMPGNWTRTFIDELENFPAGLRDDQVDALARAFNYLVAKNSRPATFIRMNVFGR